MPFVLCGALWVCLVLIFLLIEWLLLLSFTIKCGTRVGTAIQRYPFRRSFRYIWQHPVSASRGLVRVIPFVTCGIVRTAQYQAQCLLSDFCLCVPKAECWVWLVEHTKRVARRKLGKVSQSGHALPAAQVTTAECQQCTTTYRSKRTRVERRADENRRWLELQNPRLLKRRERSQRRRLARARRTNAYIRRALYLAVCRNLGAVFDSANGCSGGGNPAMARRANADIRRALYQTVCRNLVAVFDSANGRGGSGNPRTEICIDVSVSKTNFECKGNGIKRNM